MKREKEIRMRDAILAGNKLRAKRWLDQEIIEESKKRPKVFNRSR